MSEYQYYEFLAIDKPLTQRQIAEVREFSSRAAISATSFKNEYHWGDFRGSVERFLTRYYDLHVYFANWGTRVLAIAAPAAFLVFAEVGRYKASSFVDLRRVEGRVIITFTSQNEEGDWEEGDDDWMGSLAPLREEILNGDLRPLYLAWLASVQSGELGENTSEPPLPPGLGKLTTAQKALTRFLRLDADLLDVAATQSPAHSPSAPDLGRFLNTLALADKDRLLRQMLEDGPAAPLRELRSLLRNSAPPASLPSTGRTVGELRSAAQEISRQRERERAARAAREKAWRDAEQAAARAHYLNTLASRHEQTWQQVERLIARTQPKFYEQAITLLNDLRDLAALQQQQESFQLRIAALHQRHAKKPSFLDRLRNAGLSPTRTPPTPRAAR